jgi:hypothetical protein
MEVADRFLNAAPIWMEYYRHRRIYDEKKVEGASGPRVENSGNIFSAVGMRAPISEISTGYSEDISAFNAFE